MSIWSEDYKAIKARLKKARLAAGLKQTDVAKLLNRPQSYISDCEKGDKKLDVLELKEFAKLYKKPISYFLKV